MNQTAIRCTIYWDTQDPQNEGWAYRVHYTGGHEESGSWDSPVNDLAESVVSLAHQYGVTITSGHVAVEDVDGGCAEWTAEA